jgi:hypothetical protein
MQQLTERPEVRAANPTVIDAEPGTVRRISEHRPVDDEGPLALPKPTTLASLREEMRHAPSLGIRIGRVLQLLAWAIGIRSDKGVVVANVVLIIVGLVALLSVLAG